MSAAIGVAVATVGVSFPLNILHPPVPYEMGSRLLVLAETGLASSEYAHVENDVLQVSRGVIDDLRMHTDVFETVIAYAENTSIMLRDAPGTSNVGHGVPHDLLPRLGIKAALGRLFVAEEDQPGRGQVIVLGNRWWRTRFGGDPEIVGKTIRTDDGDYTVVGVLEADKVFPPQWGSEFYLPLGSNSMRYWRSYSTVSAVAIVRRGVSASRVRSATDAAAARHGAADREALRARLESFGRTHVAQSTPVRVVASPFRRPPVRNTDEWTQTALMMGLGLTILLIAALNIAGLSLARMVARRSELAVRTALGAQRRRLIGSLVAETSAVVTLGGAMGFAAASSFLGWVRKSVDAGLASAFAFNARFAFVALGVTLLASLIAVLWPAVKLGRANLTGMIKSGRDSWSRSSAGGFRRVIAIQVALTCALCVGAAAFIGAIGRYLRVDRGFDPASAFAIQVSTPESETDRVAALQSAMDVVAAMPGVESVGAGALPVRGQFTLDVGVAATPGAAARGMLTVLPVAGDYVAATGMRIVSGRAITNAEARDGAHVAVIASSLATQLWRDSNAVGKRVYLGDGAAAVGYDVIGVARDVTIPFPRPLSQVYVPFGRRLPRLTNIVARVRGDASAFVNAAQSALSAGAHSVEVRSASTLAAAVKRGAGTQTQFAMIFSVLAVIGLVMAGAGLYGVTLYTTGQRTREFGIRLALGATTRALVAATLREAITPVASGLVVGLCGGVVIAMLLRSQLFGVSPADPFVLGAVALVILIVAAGAALHPALKVARTDPATPLRAE